MDVNDLRIGVTVLSFIAFMGIVAWALSRKNAAGFADAAQLPFRESEQPAEKGSQP